MNGSPCLFTIELSNPSSSVTGTWQGHKLTFFRTRQDPERWYAIAGIDVGAKPGDYDLSVTIDHQGDLKALHRTIHVAAAPYTEIPLTVPEKFVQPDAHAQKIIAADQVVKRKAFSDSAPTPLWSGKFISPLQTAPSTDSFGTRRVFNGSLASIHRGLDYRAKPGTPIRAANAGRVILARPLYFEGNCVVIDHGLGLMTIYMHLSKFNVKKDQLVKRGQLIARSGRTGRATGPHLHLSVRWQGEYLDPAKLFLIALPESK
jgi:murein DD-endopeptidase MepM/ murein hydrolase activator NlpD